MQSTSRISKKILSLILAAMMVLSLLPSLPRITVLAAETTNGSDDDNVFGMLFDENAADANANAGNLPYRDGSQLLSVRNLLYGQSSVSGTSYLFGKNGRMYASTTDSSYTKEEVRDYHDRPFTLPESFSGVTTSIKYLNALKIYEGNFSGKGRKDEIAVVCTATYMRAGTEYSALILAVGDAENFAYQLNIIHAFAEVPTSSAQAFNKLSPSEIYHYADVICADLNGDGIDEIILAPYGCAHLSVYYKNASGWNGGPVIPFGAPSYPQGLHTPTINDLTIGKPGVAFSMSAGDIDRDGCEDIVYAASALVHGDYTGAFRSAYVVYGSKKLSDLSKSSQWQKLDIGDDEGTGAADGDDVKKPGFGCIGVTMADIDNTGQLQVLAAYKEIHGIYFNKKDTTYWATYYAVRRLDFTGRGKSFQYQTVYRAQMKNYVRISLTDRVTSAPLKIAKLDYDYGRKSGVSNALSSGSIVVNGIVMSYVKYSDNGMVKYSCQPENKDFYPAAYDSMLMIPRAGEIDNKVEVYALRRGTLTGGGDGYLLHYNFYSVPTYNGNTYFKWYDCSASGGTTGSKTAYREITAVSGSGTSWRFYALPQLDNRSVTLKYKKHEFFWSDPVILAALASPPYFSVLPNEKYKDGSTAYGKYTQSQSGDYNSSSYSVGAYVAAEIKLGGPGVKAVMESEIEYNHSWTTETEKTKTFSYTAGFATSAGDDSVILCTQAFDVYFYTLSYPSSNEPGAATASEDYLVVVPRGGASASQIQTISYKRYNELRSLDSQGVFPDLSGVFSHTIGKPETYPATQYAVPTANLVQGSTLLTNTGSGFPSTEGFAMQRIEVTETNTTKTTQGNSVSVKLGGGIEFGSELVGGAKITAGVTGSADWTKGKIVSDAIGVYFEANVYGQNDGNGNDSGTFTYELMRYVYTDNPANDKNKSTHEFPVVTYVVTGVKQPQGVVPSSVNVTAVSGSVNETITDKQTATFTVNASGITRAAKTELVGAPFGMEYASGNIQQASQSIAITIDSNVKTGEYPLKLLIGGVLSNEFTLTVHPLVQAAKIKTDALTGAVKGQAYSQTLSSLGNAPQSPVTWNVEVGNLPDGLTLNQNTGEISGIPVAGGIYNFTIEASNIKGTDTKDFSIEVIIKLAGSGTVSDPYLISAAEDLAKMAEWVNADISPYADPDVYYKLVKDLDLSDYGEDYSNSFGGKGWAPIGWSDNGTILKAFKGNFDGANHTISNLYINHRSTRNTSNDIYKGLFGCVAGATIKNINLVDVDIRGSDDIGDWTAISVIGGLVGGTTRRANNSIFVYSEISNCSVTGTVIGSDSVGGLIGSASFAAVSNCYTDCVVSSTVWGSIGGIAGSLKGYDGFNTTIINCLSASTVNGFGSDVGGIVGSIKTARVENCYSIGEVSGSQYVGGIVGAARNESMIGQNCVINSAALNPNIHYDTDKYKDDSHRIVGTRLSNSSYPLIMSGNIAWSGMTANEGSAAWDDAESFGNKYNGESKTKEEIINGSAFVGLFTDSVWTHESGKLPGLFGKAVDLPEHLIQTYEVTFSVTGENGSLTATSGGADIASGASIQEGENIIFTATPGDGYRVKEWKLTEVPVSGHTSNDYTLANLTGAATVTVEFEEIPTGHEVIFRTTGGGTLSATVDGAAINSGDYVAEGKNVVFTALPDAADPDKGIINGYYIKQWTVDGINVPDNAKNNFTLTNLQNSTLVTAEFEEISMLVTSIIVSGEDDATTITTNGETLQMSAEILPAEATVQTVTWSVMNGTGNATISETGLLTAIGNGTVTVTATANDGSGIYDELEVTISGQIAPTYDISLNPSSDKTFDTVAEGYEAQAAHVVTINNTGNRSTGTLTITLSGTHNNSFTLSKTSITDIAVSDNDSFTVVQNTGLSAGIYTATVTVSGDNVTAQSFDITFEVTDNAPSTYTVTVNGGTGATGSGSYEQGKTVNISAGTPPADQQFKNWTTTSTGVTFADANNSTTTFIMPANAVTVTANFERISESFYNQLFENEDSSSKCTFRIGADGKDYIVGGVPAGMTVGDLGLADGVEVYKGSEKVTGKLGTGMVIKKGDISVTVIIKGDITGKGTPDIEDAQLFLESLVGNGSLNEAQELAVEDIVDENDSAIKKLRAFLTFVTKK